MRWKVYQSSYQNYGMQNMVDVNTYIGTSDEMPAGDIYIIAEHHTKKGAISGYSLWYQTLDHVRRAGTNFGIKLKRCSSYHECMRFAESIQRDVLDGNMPKNAHTQYFDDTIVASERFRDN